MTDVRKDYYVVESGKAAPIFDRIIEQHRDASVAAETLAKELGGIGAGSLPHPFDVHGGGMSAVVFSGTRAPKGWRRHPRFQHPEGALGCIPNRNTKTGKETAKRMAAVGNGIRRTPPGDLFRLFSPEQTNEGAAWIIRGHRLYFPTAGYAGERRIVVIPRDATVPPTDAPTGCRRVEQWEALKWQKEAEEKQEETTG